MSVAHTLPPIDGRRSFLGRLVRARELGLVILIVALVALTSVSQPGFLFSDGGWRELLRQPTILILISLGEAIVIITRNIDLSVGSVLCLSTYTAGTLFANVPGIPIVLVILIGIALGAVLGLVNGLLVAFLRVPSLVITLGTLYAYRGIAILWIGPHFIRSSWLPAEYRSFGTLQVFGIPVLLLVVLVVVLLIGWFMTSRRAGRDLYALGSNPEAATLFGLGERRLTLAAFVTSGALAGLGGLVYLAIFATGDAQVGTGYELQAVAAAVVGGVAIVGGSGTIWGVALGGFFLATISNALPVLGLVNGLLVAFLRVPSLVITLGTLYAYRGIAILWIGPHFIRSSWLPAQYRSFGTLQFFGIPVLLLVVLVVVLLIGWFMTSRRSGRDLYALGSNPEAATLFGLGERRLTLAAFVTSGALAGLGGLVYLAIFATGDAQVGTGYELQAVAAAVVGGVAIVGGSGTIWGVALGGFFLATISNALPVLGVPSLWQQAIVGILIVGAILLDRILFITRTRRAKRRGSAA
jgi:rhamnose transport system permease protein